MDWKSDVKVREMVLSLLWFRSLQATFCLMESIITRILLRNKVKFTFALIIYLSLPGISGPTFVLLSPQLQWWYWSQFQQEKVFYKHFFMLVQSVLGEHTYNVCESKKRQIEQIDLQLLISTVWFKKEQMMIVL